MSDVQRPLVMHVIHHLVIGGMENGLVNLINHMPEERYAHVCVCIEDFSSFRSRIERSDVEVIALQRSRIGIWELRRQLYHLCKQLKPAIVHTRNLSGLDALLPSWLAAVPHRVHGEHGWDVGDLRGAGLRSKALRTMHSPLVNKYVAVSRDLASFLRHRIGIRQSRISQIYNGVDTTRFAPRRGNETLPVPDNFREQGVVVFGTVGRLQAVKDQATLIRAFGQLTREHPRAAQRARLMLVGDGPLRNQLKDLADSLALAGRIHFTGASDDVPATLAAMDVFVLPSLNEGVSNTVLEAMASGLPVLATSVGGNPELVRDDVTGRLFPPQDVEKLCSLMAQYLDEPEQRVRHGGGARRRALDEFSLQTMVDRYVDLYDSLH